MSISKRDLAFVSIIGFSLFLGGCKKAEVPAQQGQAPSATTASEAINVKMHPVQFDKDMGASIARIGEGKLKQLAATIVELPAGGMTPQRRLLAEEMIYVISGQGHTLIWNKATGKKEQLDWKEGDILSPTINAWRQHVNGSPSETARFLSVSTIPLTKKMMFENQELVDSANSGFDERWKSNLALGRAPQYIPGGEGAASVRMTVGHILPDIKNRTMKARGNNVAGITITPDGDMAGNRLLEMEVREFLIPEAFSPNPGHRQLWEAVYLVLKGTSQTLLQREGEPLRRFNTAEGDLYLVVNEFHRDQANGATGGRRLQIKATGYFRNVGIEDYLMTPVPAGWPK